jgi:hypothetical protein
MPLFWTFAEEDHSTLQMCLQRESCSLYFDSAYNYSVARTLSAVHFSVKISVLFAMAATLFIFDNGMTVNQLILLLDWNASSHKYTSIVIKQDSKVRSACTKYDIICHDN